MVKKTKTTIKTPHKSVTKKTRTHKTTPSPFKSKLGHDPLSWINGEDAQELGISFDDIESNVDETPYIPEEKILPKADVYEEPAEVRTEVASAPVKQDTAPVENLADQGWGLFDDDIDVPGPEVHETQAEVISDDGTWGLFGDEPALPVGEGVAWGLFSDEFAEDSTVDSSAQVINLPAVFNVAEMDKYYHQFERLINEEHDVIVDASETENIDACGLQLLYASHKALQKRNCKLVMKDSSEKIGLLSKASFINEILGING